MKKLTCKEAAKLFNTSYSTFKTKVSRPEFNKFFVKDFKKFYPKHNGGKKKPYYRLMDFLIVDKEFTELMKGILNGCNLRIS